MPTKTKRKGSHSNYDKADRILREARARRMAAIKAPALRGTAAKRAAERGLFTPDPEDLPGRGLQIVAEGDSWFDYKVIIRSDILECLRDLGYRVEHDAKAGDLIDRMAHEPHQLPAVLDLIQRHKPRFMLLSGGGNDIAGAELAMLVNHRNSALAQGGEVLRKGVVDYIMDTAIKGAYQRVIDTCLDAARQANIPKFQIIGHGYDYPFADGRAVIDVGPIEIIGPWLEPPLKVRGYLSEADRNRDWKTSFEQREELSVGDNDACARLRAEIQGSAVGALHRGCPGDAGALVLQPQRSLRRLWLGHRLRGTQEPAPGQPALSFKLLGAELQGRNSA
jgi:hypothetical protein